MTNHKDLEKIMDTYSIPKEDRTDFKVVWDILDSYGKISTQNVDENIYGKDISVVKTILDTFR